MPTYSPARNIVDFASWLGNVSEMKQSAPLWTALCLMFAALLPGCSSKTDSSSNDSVANTAKLPGITEAKNKAEAGDAQAQCDLGDIYAEGKQVRQDYKQASEWYRKAAEQGHAKAQFNLGGLYDIGQGVAHDEAEAAKWYLKAAEQGNAAAQYTIAGMYGLGRGVPLNPKEALRWYERSAEQGDELGRYNLAERYERGKDVSQDLVEAYKWHSLAAERGLKDAMTAKAHLEKQMTSEQISEARKRVRAFNEKFPLTSRK